MKYESQFVWDDDAQEPIVNLDNELYTESGGELGGKRTTTNNNFSKKQGKKTIELITQENSPSSIKDRMQEHGETPFEVETECKTDV
eukprot:11861081-Ditylum_brightwellii.AAC.1